ncbi:MAG: tripartite tricarboxylate transporter TctB family protein [Sulfitobacter sp.]
MNDSREAVRTEIAAAALLVGAALFALLWLIPNHTQAPTTANDVSPAFFPRLAALVVLFLALTMIAVRLTRNVVASVNLPGPAILREMLIWAVAGVVIFILLPVIGFVPTSTLTIAVAAAAAGYRRWLVIAVLAIAFSFLVDFGAWQIFTVDLP